MFNQLSEVKSDALKNNIVQQPKPKVTLLTDENSEHQNNNSVRGEEHLYFGNEPIHLSHKGPRVLFRSIEKPSRT